LIAVIISSQLFLDPTWIIKKFNKIFSIFSSLHLLASNETPKWDSRTEGSQRESFMNAHTQSELVLKRKIFNHKDKYGRAGVIKITQWTMERK
jgi:hypothetical protein